MVILFCRRNKKQIKGIMNEKFSGIRTPISPQLSFHFVSFSLLLIPGLADISSSSSSTNEKGIENDKSSRSSTGLTILILCLGLIAVVAFSVFLYKLWQKKKREEQHARLLKLFEQDDDLEVELGIRD